MNGQAVRTPAYDPDFKAECVERVLHAGATAEDTRRVAEEMGVPESTLIYWTNTARQGMADAEDIPPGEEKEELMPRQTRARRKHDPEFKAAAIERVRGGESLSHVARDIDVASSVVSRWMQIANEEAVRAEKARDRAAKKAAAGPRPSARHHAEPPASQLAFPHPRTHVLAPNESATTMALRAENELLKRRNRLLKDMLDLAMRDHGLTMIEAEHG